MSVFVHAQGINTVHAGEGVKNKKLQNSVHVVIEYPLIHINFDIDLYQYGNVHKRHPILG